MTVEGEKDDITGTGQCSEALDLCSGISAARKAHFECPTVGHYGIFNGSRFRSEIAPRVAAFVRMHAGEVPRKAPSSSLWRLGQTMSLRRRAPGTGALADVALRRSSTPATCEAAKALSQSAARHG